MSVNKAVIIAISQSADNPLVKAILYGFDHVSGRLSKVVRAVSEFETLGNAYDFGKDEGVTHIEVPEHLLSVDDSFCIVGNPGVIYVALPKTKAAALKKFKDYTLLS